VKRLLRARTKNFNRVLRVLGILVFVGLSSEAGRCKDTNKGVIFLRVICSMVPYRPCERVESLSGRVSEVRHIASDFSRRQYSIGAQGRTRTWVAPCATPRRAIRPIVLRNSFDFPSAPFHPRGNVHSTEQDNVEGHSSIALGYLLGSR